MLRYFLFFLPWEVVSVFRTDGAWCCVRYSFYLVVWIHQCFFLLSYMNVLAFVSWCILMYLCLVSVNALLKMSWEATVLRRFRRGITSSVKSCFYLFIFSILIICLSCWAGIMSCFLKTFFFLKCPRIGSCNVRTITDQNVTYWKLVALDNSAKSISQLIDCIWFDRKEQNIFPCCLQIRSQAELWTLL